MSFGFRNLTFFKYFTEFYIYFYTHFFLFLNMRPRVNLKKPGFLQKKNIYIYLNKNTKGIERLKSTSFRSFKIIYVCLSKICRVNHKTFVILFMLQKISLFLLIVFAFIMSLIMVAINKTMD